MLLAEAREHWASERYPQAETTYRQALAVAESQLSDTLELATILRELATLRCVQEQYKDACDLAKRSVEILKQQLGPDDVRLAEALQVDAEALFGLRQHSEAEASLKVAIELVEKQPLIDGVQLAALQYDLGELLHYIGRYVEAVELLNSSLALKTGIFGSDHIELADTLEILACTYAFQSFLERDPEPYYRRVIAIRCTHAKQWPDAYAMSMWRFARYLTGKKREREAEEICEQILEVAKSNTLTPTNARMIWENYISLAEAMGEHDKAANLRAVFGEFAAASDEQYQREDLDRVEKLLGTDHPKVADQLCGVATNMSLTKRFHQAEQLFLRALAIREREFDPNHPKVADVLEDLSISLRDQKRFEEADVALSRALQIRKATEDWKLGRCYELFAFLEVARGGFNLAEWWGREALTIAEKEFEPDSYALAESLWGFGLLLERCGEFEKVLHICERLSPLAEIWVHRDQSAFDYLALHARALYGLNKTAEWQKMVQHIQKLMAETGRHFDCSDNWLKYKK